MKLVDLFAFQNSHQKYPDILEKNLRIRHHKLAKKKRKNYLPRFAGCPRPGEGSVRTVPTQVDDTLHVHLYKLKNLHFAKRNCSFLIMYKAIL